MKIKNLRFLVIGLVFSLMSLGSLLAKYPDKYFSLTVAYGPGGATDFQARIVTMTSGDKKLLQQPMIIINKPGSGGRNGWNWFASKAKKDGYDLAAYNMPHFIAQSIKYKTKYNINNLEPIANWGAEPAVLIVGKKSKLNTVEKFIDYAKKNPGKVTISGAGLYVGHHIAYLQLEKAAGLKLKYIPNPQGGAAALKAVIGGQVMAGFNNLGDSYRSKDNLIILAVADLKRNSDFLPKVPTFKEKGIDIDDTSVNFRGIMVRKGTAKSKINFLAKQVPGMFNHPRSLKQMKKTGSVVRVIGREEMKKMWKEKETFLKNLLKDL